MVCLLLILFIFLERLINGIHQMKHVIAAKFGETVQENQEEFSTHVEKISKSALSKSFFKFNSTLDF